MEGIDQSGKRTQTRLLANHLRRKGFKVRTVGFPIYTTPAGLLIRKYLAGKQTYQPQALHMLYSVNRWENLDTLDRLVKTSDFLIADRYVPSNLAYGVTRGLGLEWLEQLDDGLPKSALVIVLDVPIRSSIERKTRNRDRHERDKRLLRRVRRTYQTLSSKLGWKTIDGNKPVMEVHSAIWTLVSDRFELKS